jgi:hypothetical protein
MVDIQTVNASLTFKSCGIVTAHFNTAPNTKHNDKMQLNNPDLPISTE